MFFINKHQLHRSKDLIILVSSLSGGSGNVILSEMLKKLLTTDAIVIGLVVADSTSKKYIDNSLDSFVTLNTVATKLNPFPVLYFNNKVYQKNFDSDKVKMANKDILTVINTLTIFTSGMNKDIDDKDMEFLFKPQQYNIRKGIYGLSVGKCELAEKELHEKRALLGRTLLASDADVISPLANSRVTLANVSVILSPGFIPPISPISSVNAPATCLNFSGLTAKRTEASNSSFVAISPSFALPASTKSLFKEFNASVTSCPNTLFASKTSKPL